MNHYTLLPEHEMKSLRHEYRTRLFIVALFFISCGIALGIATLIPAYILSSAKEGRAQAEATELFKKNKVSGTAQAEKDLVRSQTIVKKIIVEEGRPMYSDILQGILAYRSTYISITSLDLSRPTEVAGATGTTTPAEIIIQGKSATRESLVAFKKSLEGDKKFLKVELPLSDLAKSKNITFTMKLTMGVATVARKQ